MPGAKDTESVTTRRAGPLHLAKGAASALQPSLIPPPVLPSTRNTGQGHTRPPSGAGDRRERGKRHNAPLCLRIITHSNEQAELEGSVCSDFKNPTVKNL